MTEKRKLRLAAEILLKSAEKLSDIRFDIDLPADELLSDIIAIASDISGSGSEKANECCESIFNILNGASHNAAYSPAVLSDDVIDFPSESPAKAPADYSASVKKALADFADSFEISAESVNSLLEIIENYGSYTPDNAVRPDIPVYDVAKLTAALALCIYDRLKDNGQTELVKEDRSVLSDSKMFLIFSADISGIQSFIYNISSKSALKGLRARSFWLEIMLEDIIDELLCRLELLRCNVMYTGGGHSYMILPNTERVRSVIDSFSRELNCWFEEYFGTELYIGCGYAECSADELNNKTEGSYRDIFRRISEMISRSKLNRYTAAEIIRLNSRMPMDSERECVICKRSDRLIKAVDNPLKSNAPLSDEDTPGAAADTLRLNQRVLNSMCCCEICAGLLELSYSIIDERKDGGYFSVLSERPDNESSVVLPFGQYLVCDSRETLRRRISEDSHYLRSYVKNRIDAELHASRMWVGDYCAEKEMSRLLEHSGGVNRLAVLRADIDNLGQSFVNGFDDDHVNIMRTAEFSSKMSLFFKHDINTILRQPRFRLDDSVGGRNAVIIYSGGDDVFAIGSRSDIVGFAIDLNDALNRYSLGTLTISAGIGLFPVGYPIYEMAAETGRLEDHSKSAPGKNSVTLFSEESRYTWTELTEKVIGEKYMALRQYLDNDPVKGTALLYNMLELIRARNEENRLNIARFAYLLARVRPEDENSPDYNEKLKRFNVFKKQVYNWIQDENDARQLVTAIYLFVYTERERTKNDDRQPFQHNIRTG